MFIETHPIPALENLPERTQLRALFEWTYPVLVAKERFLDKRPLMRLADEVRGVPSLIKYMQDELIELDDELNKVKGIPIERLNGQRADILAEAADVLVFAAATPMVVGRGGLSHDEADFYLHTLKRVADVQRRFKLDVIGTAVGVIQTKNDINYPAWAFQAWPTEELTEESLERHRTSVYGLKAMRRDHPKGLLLPNVLISHGFTEQVTKSPASAYRFLEAKAALWAYVQ